VASGFLLEARAADRISAAVEAAQTGAPPPPAACYPRLIWVSDEASDFESAVSPISPVGSAASPAGLDRRNDQRSHRDESGE